jgi:hypothetical protein
MEGELKGWRVEGMESGRDGGRVEHTMCTTEHHFRGVLHAWQSAHTSLHKHNVLSAASVKGHQPAHLIYNKNESKINGHI